MNTFYLRTALVAGLLAGPATAATIDATGTGMGSASNEAMPVAEGLVVIKAQSDYTGFEAASADNPLATASGPCWGSILVNMGAVSGSGLCHYTDSAGDVAVVRWVADGLADNRTQGTWEMIGGTGKFAAASGGGRFDAGEDASGSYTNNVTGEMNMP